MAVKILEIDTANRRRVKAFLELPFQIYAHIPQWVPPMETDARSMLDRKKNPYFLHSEAAFFLAVDENDRPIGRLAVLDNRRYNDYNQESTAFFYLFECSDNHEAARALFHEGESWAHQHNLTVIRGPKGFSPFDGMGLLVKGFEHRPAYGLPYNPPYYPSLLEAEGYQPREEIVSGYLSASVPFPEKIHRASELIQKRRGLRIVSYKSRKDLRALVPRLRDLYNSSLEGTTGNYPISAEEVKNIADQLLWFADPSLIKIIEKDDQPVGYLFAYPDISAALQHTGGKLFPFGWFWLFRELKKTQWININGAGIIEQYRGLGGTAILFSEMQKSIANSRYKHADLVQIGLENDRMQRELRELGIDFYKSHRLYEKTLFPG